jgi:alginate O-acetyltransferase complex protein AlgI
MLFNSHLFIFLFLPATLIGYAGLSRIRPVLGIAWLTAASLLFYAWWEPRFLPLLLGSIAMNYGFGFFIGRSREHRAAKMWLIAGVTLNLLALSYFKYADFFLASLAQVLPIRTNDLHVELPLGISFFTFTQIAYLVDVYRGLVREYDALRYALFVSYFPHLIAGPLLHHEQMMPQFSDASNARPRASNFAVGLTVFTIGLAKKILLADNFASFADATFDAPHGGIAPTLLFAWMGALCYTFQLYFDFSGYSDMAIGVSRLFGIHLPQNFNSPYKAVNIIEFWRRWHMTLSQFLRDYLYIPLGGNRLGGGRRYFNLMITMLLGGLWHGAHWTFVAWGGLHGLYLMVNHAWRHASQRFAWDPVKETRLGQAAGLAVTFLSVVVAWVFFRADGFGEATTILRGMVGLNGISLPPAMSPFLNNHHRLVELLKIDFHGLVPEAILLGALKPAFLIVGGFVITWGLPNTQEWLAWYSVGWHKGKFRPMDAAGRQAWRPSVGIGIVAGLIFVICVLYMESSSKFLYFQF